MREESNRDEQKMMYELVTEKKTMEYVRAFNAECTAQPSRGALRVCADRERVEGLVNRGARIK